MFSKEIEFYMFGKVTFFGKVVFFGCIKKALLESVIFAEFIINNTFSSCK